MEHAIDEPIIEGFICPRCMSVFRTPDILRMHFDKEHAVEAVPSKTDTHQPSPFRVAVPSVQPSHSYAFYEQPSSNQPMGCTRSWNSELRKWRAARISRVAEQTNMLLIRLEKLICLPALKPIERREAEQAVVSWIDTKVDLCPSCGKRFGLGVEEAFPEDTTANAVSCTDRSKGKISLSELSRRTLALLDYNPVFRRRHHCRLCGHILCADCSVFLDRESAVRLVKAIDRHNLDHSDSSAPVDQAASEYQRIVFLPDQGVGTPLLDFEREPSLASRWRVCRVCREIIEKKWDRLRERYRTSPLVQIHTDLKCLMDKVNQSMPGYSTIAKSLHSGEQRYDLEMAKTMRHELLESLQQIDVLRKQLEKLESTPIASQPPNLTFIRVVRAISNMARQFVQHNLPPLRVLPTLRQYDSLTAQRRDELASRWAQEEQTIAELEKCLADSQHASSSSNRRRPNPQTVKIEDLSRLAARIDHTASQLMYAKRSAGTDPQLIASLTAELTALERQFQTSSQLLQRSAT